MNENNTQIVKAGPGLATLLVVLFIALKLCGVIAWSWVWVLSPIWISIALVVAMLGIAGIFLVVGKE
jgi:hypothetical protein